MCKKAYVRDKSIQEKKRRLKPPQHSFGIEMETHQKLTQTI